MSVTARRVQLYLPEAQYQSAKQLAQQKHASFAQIVREALEAFLQQRKARWDDDPITQHVGHFKSKDRDLSTHHDRYLYGG